MSPEETNVIEVKRSRPVKNVVVYKAIVPRNLSSVSGFSEGSIIVSELNSTSQPIYFKEEDKRKA